MEILSIKCLRGPNYWSNTRTKLIALILDLKEYEALPSDCIGGFTESLKQLLPSLYNHQCSENKKGGFFKRLEEGTWLGHVIEHVALELQWLAGMPCGFGRTRSTQQKGIYHVVFSYEIENAGIYAAHAAVKLIHSLAQQKPYTLLSHDLTQLKNIQSTESFGPSTQSLIHEAENRNIPYFRLDNASLIQLGQGCHQKIVCATSTCQTSAIAVDIAGDKEKTKKLLAQALIPIPKGVILTGEEELTQALAEVGFPCVIKPADGNHGRGITTNIQSEEKALSAFKLATLVSNRIIVEKYIKGADYRFLVINYKLIAVAKRSPATIVGTGNHTIHDLIDITNEHPDRGEHHEKSLSKIKVDELTLSILSEKSLTLQSILPAGQVLQLKHAANLSTGGTAVDVTHKVHPQIVFLAERIARLMHLDICGIDILARNITMPLTEENGAVIEVNSSPGFRMHLSPEQGESRNVAKPVIDMLFPAGQPSRIPIVAVTGTNGKTTTVRLIAHLAKEAGFCVGFTSTEGIYINQQEIYQGDCSGPTSAQAVLKDPLINFAVLECARGGILRSGLGFDQCSISIVTNISEDHLGLEDIHTLEDMARVKEVVARSTLDSGYAILNADDDLVYRMKDIVCSNVALFSLESTNDRIHQHCQQGGLAAYIENDHIIIKKGLSETILGKISSIPLSFSGKARAMVQNILPSVLAAVISEFDTKIILQGLHSFYPTPEQLPGRMTMYDFNKFNIMIDYVHNEGGFIELKHYLDQLSYSKKIGVIAATGDRKISDIRRVGFYAAEIFDEIIIRHDEDGRGSSNNELSRLLLEGIQDAKTKSSQKVKIISNEQEALEYAMKHASEGSFILYFPEDVLKASEYLKQKQKEMASSEQLFV